MQQRVTPAPATGAKRANQGQGREDKKKKRKALRAFLVFLQRLRAACKVMETLDEWHEATRELAGLLQEYGDVIPPERFQRIEEAMRPVDATRAGIKQACKVLGYEIEQLTKVLPAGGGFARVLIGGLVVVAVVVGAVVGYLEYTAVEVAIVNDGCSPIVLPGLLPISIPGISLPERPILPGGREKATVPRIRVGVDATQADTVALIILGVSVPYRLGGDISSVRVDGVEILGQRTSIDLAQRREHELVVSCR